MTNLERITRWMFCILLFFIVFLPEDIQAVKCYKCQAENDNCNNPFKAWKPGVTFCEGMFCFKSTATVLGQTATARDCSDKESLVIGCEQDSIALGSKSLCICNTTLCNTTTKVNRNPHLLLFLMFIMLPFPSYAT